MSPSCFTSGIFLFVQSCPVIFASAFSISNPGSGFLIPAIFGECRQTSSLHERNPLPNPAGVADVQPHIKQKSSAILLAVTADFIAPDRSEMTVVATNSFLFSFLPVHTKELIISMSRISVSGGGIHR
jgi:hypothetical protein